ncbi:MAG: hypothetical protein A2219_08815 [Elusimicrobia bacterium RIFOXYA2_FULL_50_26]|nr:MAG: hypothetical protein A2219_08815 [Elusimicrobia bacterium RIFOXYA2_FULL_50_26]
MKHNKYFRVPAILGRKRLARRMPRNAEERESLMMHDYARYKQFIRNGILVEISARKFKIRLY